MESYQIIDESKPSPDICIAMVTFNHEKYLSQALDSILEQKTTYSYKIIVAEDRSTDSTREILLRYQNKHPQVFKLILQHTNKGVQLNNFDLLSNLEGKYFAALEGDDYWVDPYKLQKQIDFLEANPEYKVSMGRVDMLMENTGKIKRRKEEVDPIKTETYSLKDYLKHPFSQTSSFVFRRLKEPLPEWIKDVHAGDKSLVLLHTGKNGKIKYHPDLFSIYRVNDASVSNNTDYNVYDRSNETIEYWRSFLGKEFNTVFKWIRIRNSIYKKNNNCKSLLCRIWYIGWIKVVNYYMRFL